MKRTLRLSPGVRLALLLAAGVASASAGAVTYLYRIPSQGLVGPLASPPPSAAPPSLVFEDYTTFAPLPSIVAFHMTGKGALSPEIRFVVVNNGAGDANLNASSLALAGPFNVTYSDCTTTLPPSQQCTFGLVFAPTAAQSYSGTVSLNVSSGSGSISQSLSGVGAFFAVTDIAMLESVSFLNHGNGTWYVTGYNGWGDAGMGTTTWYDYFVVNPNLNNVTKIYPGQHHFFAQKSDGSWIAAGDNSKGQLGLGTATLQYATPTAVPGLAGVVKVVVGPNNVFAKKSTGAWVAAGANSFGELGIAGSTSKKTSLTAVPLIANALQVVPGDGHTFYQKSDGTWWAIGDNQFGELGLGDYANRTSWTAVPGLSGATMVTTAWQNTFARMADGHWVAAGNNQDGSLGVGDTLQHASFVTVPGISGAVSVQTAEAANGTHSVALMADGHMLGAGNDALGQINATPYGGSVSVFTPVLNTSAPHIAAQVAVSTYRTIFRQSDNQGFEMGGDYLGSLGAGYDSGPTGNAVPFTDFTTLFIYPPYTPN